MTHPWDPVSPLSEQSRKKPSIFSFTPPTGWISPCWFTDPVTAKPWSMGTPDNSERRAQISATEALSPSTPE